MDERDERNIRIPAGAEEGRGGTESGRRSEGEPPAGEVPGGGGPEPRGKGGGRRPLLIGLLLLLCLGGGIFGGPRAYYAWTHESTDDAYVDGTLVSVAPEVGGRILAVGAEEHAPVRKGQALLEIDASDYAADLAEKKAALDRARAEREELGAQRQEAERALAQARATAIVAQAGADLAEKRRRRSEGLLREGLVALVAYDQAAGVARSAAARLEAARQAVAQAEALLGTLGARGVTRESQIREAGADLERSRLELSRTVLRSPVSGIVAKRSAEVGKYAQKGQTLFVLVGTERLWVTANFKETQIEGIRVGSPVDIRVDAYPDRILKGHVESFQPGTGAAFSLLPPENATGNFVKVVQRVPLRIAIDTPPDPDRPLSPGLSVVPYVRKER
jgi:membrane fusion protein (multidrug efflux system)